MPKPDSPQVFLISELCGLWRTEETMPHYWSWEADEAFRKGKEDGRYYHENSFEYDRYSDRERDKAYYDGIEEAKDERRREEEREQERQEEERQERLHHERMMEQRRQEEEEYCNAMQEQQQEYPEPEPPTEEERKVDDSQSST